MEEKTRKEERDLRVHSYIQIVLVAVIVVLFVWYFATTIFRTPSHNANIPVLTCLVVLMLLLLISMFISILAHRKLEKNLQANLNKYQKSYQETAGRDDLTNLYNRRAAISYLQSIPADSEFTILLMNVDRFKDINEVYGHEFGDHVLRVISSELLNYMKAYNGFVGRYGSDEFLIVFRGVCLNENSDAVQHMRDIIHEPIKIGLANIIPTVCIGAACSDGKTDAESVANYAEIAVREAKNRGRKSFTMFSSDLQEKINKDMDIKVRIQQAIRNDGFYMVYQPKVSAKTREVTGYEALVRMKDSAISPAVFIPIAEENGWLREIGRLTTQKAIEQIAKWREEGTFEKPVSINFSGVQIRDEGYFYFILDTLAKNRVPSRLVEIEFTEGIMLQYTKETIDLMNRFHAAGMKLALDDFGTGYSSLSYLNQFPLDIIKIDRSFVAENLKDDKHRAILRDMIRLGHDLDVQIVVEGVETKEQLDFIEQMDADIIQGFYFSQPLLPDAAIAFEPRKD